MSLSLQQVKGWIAREYTQADQSVHNFIAWVEQKSNQVDSAKTVLLAEGYTLTAPDGTVTAPTPPAA